MRNINIHSPLYNFLIEPKFRWLRHILLILSVGVAIFNEMLGVYKGKTDIINIYSISGIYILVYLLCIYLNIYWLIPKLLLKKKYIQYIFILSTTTLLLSVGHICAEYYIHRHYEIPFGYFSFFFDGRNQIISFIYTCLMTIVYFTSISTFVFYKYWMLNAQKVEQLKTEQLNSELNNLRSRISPDFLLDKLR